MHVRQAFIASVLATALLLGACSNVAREQMRREA